MTDLVNSAKRYSFKLISYRGRSERELREKLIRKGFTADIISQTIAYCKKAGYIDDEVLVQNLKRQALENRMLGYAGAKRFMLKRGLSYELIESSLYYDENKELGNAQQLLERKLSTAKGPLSAKETQRIWNFLARRGYSFHTIKKAFRNYNLTVKEKQP